jgi:endonuclease/exonuclease/phosphatase family metal-dependent hydrolase
MRHVSYLVAAAGVVVATTVSPAAQAQSFSAPTSLTARSATATTLRLSWAARTGAPGYRVQLSRTSTMSSPTYLTYATNAALVKGLAPSTRYFFRVAVVNPTTGVRLSPYTAQTYPSARTTPVATPTGLVTGPTTPTATTVSWKPSEGAPRYRVQWSTSSSFSSGNAWYGASTGSRTITGLAPRNTYYTRVRAITTTGVALTPYTGPVAVTTASAPADTTTPGPVDIRAASFNVMTVTGDQTSGDRTPWANRRSTVVSQVMGEHPDVLGAQEVDQSYTRTSHLVDGATQYFDLLNGLNEAGGSYALTNSNSYNCVHPETSYNCVYQDQGASGGNRIYYNTQTLALVRQSAYVFPSLYQSHQDGLAWAVLRVKATGTEFLFVTTHLCPPDRTVRVRQWNELIDKVNALKGTLPVVVTGDFNVQKFDTIAKTMLPAMRNAGYGDVLNQTYATNPIANPRAQSSVNGWMSSLGGWDRDVRLHSYYTSRTKTANNIDWVFASNNLPVRQWKTVVDYDPTSLQQLGTIPSDHHLVRATLTLP